MSSDLPRTQACPYCQHEVEDHQANWSPDEEEEVLCDRCDRPYISKPVYNFVGFIIEKQCDHCEEFTEDGYPTCICEDEKNLEE